MAVTIEIFGEKITLDNGKWSGSDVVIVKGARIASAMLEPIPYAPDYEYEEALLVAEKFGGEVLTEPISNWPEKLNGEIIIY